MRNKTKNFYEFAGFHIEINNRLLLRGSEVVPLTPKAFNLGCSWAVQSRSAASLVSPQTTGYQSNPPGCAISQSLCDSAMDNRWAGSGQQRKTKW